MREFNTIAVIGLGYIGLPTAALIASRGMKVHGYDVSEKVVAAIKSGHVHIGEPDLEGLVQKVISTGAMTVSTTLEPADVFVIAVPTPINHDHTPDVSYVDKAADAVAKVIQPGNLVVLESTSPIGTTEAMAKRILASRPELTLGIEAKGGNGISVAYCPERVLPGRILAELVNNDRCIGGITPSCTRRAQNFYKSFVRAACIATSARAAEMVKLSENAYRDTNIAFANELSLICARHQINVWEVIDLANRHPRVNILRPGPGVGGHCIAVDPWFIVDSAPDLARLIRTAREVNDSKIDHATDSIMNLMENYPYSNVSCWGLAFKANVDDLRESPALEVAARLAKRFGERVLIVEPYITELPKELAETGAKLVSVKDALKNTELAIVLVDHDEFKMVPIAERRHLSFIDTRGIWQDMPESTDTRRQPPLKVVGGKP